MICFGTTIAIGFAGCCGGPDNGVAHDDEHLPSVDEEDLEARLPIQRRRSSISELAAVDATELRKHSLIIAADEAAAAPPPKTAGPGAQAMSTQH
jgi:hypothetical protein